VAVVKGRRRKWGKTEMGYAEDDRKEGMSRQGRRQGRRQRAILKFSDSHWHSTHPQVYACNAWTQICRGCMPIVMR
jgi:hypothetical protein